MEPSLHRNLDRGTYGSGAVDHVRPLEDGAFIALGPGQRNQWVRGAVDHVRPLENAAFIALEPGQRNIWFSGQ
jgi:hypothetical protein